MRLLRLFWPNRYTAATPFLFNRGRGHHHLGNFANLGNFTPPISWSTMTRPLSPKPQSPVPTLHNYSNSMERPRQGRQESPVTVLDSEEEREEFYALQREKRRKRKQERGINMSESESGSASARTHGVSRRTGGRVAAAPRGSGGGDGDGDDSIRIIGVKRGRRSTEFASDKEKEAVEGQDDEIQYVGVVPTGAALRLEQPRRTSVPSGSRSIPLAGGVVVGKNLNSINDNDNSDSEPRMGMMHESDTDPDAPSALRAGLAKYKYSSYTASSHNASSSSSSSMTASKTTTVANAERRKGTTIMNRVIPTSRAAVAKLHARSFTTAATVAAVTERSRDQSRERSETASASASVTSHTGSVEEGSASAAMDESAAATAGTGKKKRASVVSKKTKPAVPDMPVAPEQIKELDGCVVCGTRFDRRKTAKTRWVS